MNNSLLSLLEFVLALSILLGVHEFGHFLMGKFFGVKVEEFGIGYPPRILKLFNLLGTDFTLNMIPFGAFVRFKGENDPQEPDGLAAANKWKRLGTLLAGPVMNILTGILLFSMVISLTGVPQLKIVEIAGVEKDSPAAISGIQQGDILKSINSTPIDNMSAVSELVQNNIGKQVRIELDRCGETIMVDLIPRQNPPDGQGPLGIVMQNPVEKIGFFQSVPFGGKIALEQLKQFLSLPSMILRGQVDSDELRLLSPKGIYDVYSHVREEERQLEEEQPVLAFINIAWFFGVISIALGFSNLLPIPALDGGRILFILPEVFVGKRIPAKYENMVHFVGYISLLMLMAYVFYQDFTNPIVIP